MATTYYASHQKEWNLAELKNFDEFSNSIRYVNQRDIGNQLEGGWWYADDDRLTIYTGTFGNFNSPGAIEYTYANVYDNKEDYDYKVAQLETTSDYVDDDIDDDECAFCGGSCPNEPEDSEYLCDGFMAYGKDAKGK